VLLSAAAVFAGAVPALAQSPAASSAPAVSMADLEAAANAEGNLSTMALDPNWCGYRAVIDGFKAKYPGIAVNEISPLAGSGDEIQAIIANKGNTGPAAPDVLDIGLSFGPDAMAQGLLQPYKVSNWATMPDAGKDPDGNWYESYYGLLAFETNTEAQPNPPTSFADLLKPDYKNQVALPGDPRTSSQAIQTVYDSALANGGSLDDAAPGLAFWRKVVDAGNFLPVVAKSGTIESGETPVSVRWSYLALADKDAAEKAGTAPIAVTLPAGAPWGGSYVQAISAYAPHPNAAKLWEEYLYSDEGQLGWLNGYCYPIRFADMKARGVIPADVLAKLPDATGAVFPTLDQLNAASKVITGQWDAVVGVAPPTAAPAAPATAAPSPAS
jgi:putative spermidine/putrescine transport system substrate-binding protein